MALDNFTNLCTEITDWLARDDLAAKVPTFIALFEAELRTKISALNVRQTDTIETEAGEPLVGLPTDAKRVLSIAHEGSCRPRLSQVASNDLLNGEASKHSGVPRRYSLEGADAIRLSPIPDGIYFLTVIFNGAFIPLSSSTATNWLLDEFPHLYLYGSLNHAKSYMQDQQAAEIDRMLPQQVQDFKDEMKRRRFVAGSASFYKPWLR